MYIIKLIYLNSSFYFFLFLFTIIYIPFVCIIILFNSFCSSFRISKRIVRYGVLWWGRVVIKILPFPLIRVCYNDLSPRDNSSPSIFISNHRSFSDGFLMACLSCEGIQIVNKWPFRMPVMGIVAKMAGYLSVNDMSFDEFLKKTCALLNEGVSVFAFPEGTRSGSKKMGQFYSAIFRIALVSQKQIVPLCIVGNEKIPVRGSLLLRPGLIKVEKLPALQWQDYKDMNSFQLKNKVREIISTRIELIEVES